MLAVTRRPKVVEHALDQVGGGGSRRQPVGVGKEKAFKRGRPIGDERVVAQRTRRRGAAAHHGEERLAIHHTLDIELIGDLFGAQPLGEGDGDLLHARPLQALGDRVHRHVRRQIEVARRQPLVQAIDAHVEPEQVGVVDEALILQPLADRESRFAERDLEGTQRRIAARHSVDRAPLHAEIEPQQPELQRLRPQVERLLGGRLDEGNLRRLRRLCALRLNEADQHKPEHNQRRDRHQEQREAQQRGHCAMKEAHEASV